MEDQLWVNSSSVDPSEGHATGMSFLLKALIFLMFCGPWIYHTSVFWPMWHQLLTEITSNILIYKRQKSPLVVQPIISWKATKLYILCTTQFTKTANKSFFFFEWFGFWGIRLSWSWPRPRYIGDHHDFICFIRVCVSRPACSQLFLDRINKFAL